MWENHLVDSHRGCLSAVMFTDDKSQMTWRVPIEIKDETAEGCQALVQEVADPEGVCIGKAHCDGGADFKGRFQVLCESLEIVTETNAPYMPQRNAIAERGVGTTIGSPRRLL